jgi:hypothetical protein
MITRHTLQRSILASVLAVIGLMTAHVHAETQAQAGTQVHLGIGVAKPDAGIYAQLPALPQGCGFILRNVAPDGPAAKAGLGTMDIIWKLDGQLLVNENQMLVLLSHKNPGDEVKLAYFRSGQQHEATVTLLKRDKHPSYPAELVISPPIPGMAAMPMRVISYEERSASISDRMGTATLMLREGKPWLHVENSQGEETFNGYVVESSEIAMVPAVWRARLPVLRRSLDESTRLRKLPRVRRVASPQQRLATDGTP